MREGDFAVSVAGGELGEAADGCEGEFDLAWQMRGGIGERGDELQAVMRGMQRMLRDDTLHALTQVSARPCPTAPPRARSDTILPNHAALISEGHGGHGERKESQQLGGAVEAAVRDLKRVKAEHGGEAAVFGGEDVAAGFIESGRET